MPHGQNGKVQKTPYRECAKNTPRGGGGKIWQKGIYGIKVDGANDMIDRLLW